MNVIFNICYKIYNVFYFSALLNMIYIVLLFFTTLIEIALFSKAKIIGYKLNLIDRPDNTRKLHTLPTPTLGGPVILSLFSIIFFVLKLYEINIFDWSTLIALSLITSLGIIDDKFNINPNLKLLLLSVILILFFTQNQNLIVNELRFSSYSYVLNLNNFAIPFTILCCLLLINSLNMTDGKNGLCGSIQIIILSFLIFFILKDKHEIDLDIKTLNLDIILILFYISFLIIFLFFNFRGLVFLGDSGSYLGAFLISYFILSTYQNSVSFNVEQILLLLILPGIDMLRVFIERIMNNKNPFIGDNNHFHHIIFLKTKSHILTTLIYCVILLLINISTVLFPNLTLNFLIIYIIIYFLLIRLIKNKMI